MMPIQNKWYRSFKRHSCRFIDLFADYRDRQEPAYLFMSKQQLFKNHMFNQE